MLEFGLTGRTFHQTGRLSWDDDDDDHHNATSLYICGQRNTAYSLQMTGVNCTTTAETFERVLGAPRPRPLRPSDPCKNPFFPNSCSFPWSPFAVAVPNSLRTIPPAHDVR